MWRRRTAAVAANLALLTAASGVVVYAVSADGYKSHRAELNDGGVWFTNAKDGFYGRVNKPIGQQDASAFGGVDAELDIVQDGAAVIGLDRVARTITAIAPDTVTLAEDGSARIPARGVVELAGGSLAVLDPATGAVRAQRVDSRIGAGTLSGVDAGAPKLAQVGTAAAVAVTLGGTILATSAGSDTVTRIAATEAGFAAPVATDLGTTLQGAAVTAVGESPVILDTVTGDLVAPGRARAVVEPGSVLQQPGPAADSVLLATDRALVSVDLDTGATTVVAEGRSGRPAAPVRLGDCAYGAWSGGRGSVVTQCGDAEPNVAQSLRGNASDLVFRVNRGQIMLNDRYSGAVWNLDVDDPTRLDNWEAFNHRDDKDSKNPDTRENDNGDRRPPKAKPDFFGARPGRTTVLHPLDNDTAPEGRILSIRSVDQVSSGDAQLTIGPDGQTVQITLPPDAKGSTSLEYYVDDGRQDVSAHATVTVAVRAEEDNVPPALRPGFKPTVWPVPAGGAVELPVLTDWRDKRDGDSLALVDASLSEASDSGAAARTTSTGRLRFTAPPKPGQVQVTYAVSDGRSEPVATDLVFRVQDPELDEAVAARAEPDVVAVDAGRWVTIRPLANDLPGADPRSPRAVLRLAGQLAAPAGADVRTDVDNGLVRFRSGAARTFALEYEAAYGDAPLAVGKIRVDVRPRESRDPVAVPDPASLYGSAPTLVDVLANDVDPGGGLLSVQGARALDPDQLDVAVVDGRWLRLSARQGQLRPSPQVVRYTVTNGARTATGEVTVSQRPVPEDNAPVTEEDQVVVRAGAAITVAPLDNDFSPSGDPLALVADVAGEAAGQLTVRGPDSGARNGRATVSGRLVRYVAPQTVSAEGATTEIRYVATNSRGDTAPGLITVSVIPAQQPNRPPAPPVVEGRATSGGTVVLKLPGVGADPDGDAVTLLGLASAPKLGRVERIGANSIEYRAYPDSHGTDQLDYTITDSLGARSTGTARVAVAEAVRPQPPLAVADTITVEPGRVATVDPVGNDLVAPGDRVTIELVDPPQGVSLESDDGPVVMEAPARADGRTVEVVYRITNGLDSSQSTITLRTASPYNNPPVVFDAFGGATDSDLARVAVLRTAYDPDGPSERLKITDLYPPVGVRARVERGHVIVARGPEPIVVPFRVEDVDGGAAIAQVFVPATGSGVPYVKPGALISLDSGKTLRARLAQYIANPTGGPVRFTVARVITASPAGAINAVGTSASAFAVSAARGYVGPGAVTVEVSNSVDETLPGTQKVLLSVPVQVGDDRPTVSCLSDAVEVPQGGRVSLNMAVLCPAYTSRAVDQVALTYAVDWQRSVEGLDIIEPTGDTIEVGAEGSVAAGSEAVLLVRAGDSEPARLRVKVVGAAAPSLAPIRITDLRAGDSRLIDLAPYLVPGVPDAVPTFVRATKISGPDVTVTSAGGSSVRVAAGASVSGRADFRVVLSDVASTSEVARQASNVLSVELLGVPDAPPAPVPGSTVLSGAVQLTWRAPAANGSPIDSYEVRASNGDTKRCPTTSCLLSGLSDGTSYTFTVRAHNSVGWSPFSASSRQATPNAVPGVVGPIRLTKADDQVLSLAWTPPTTGGRIDKYRITWRDGGQKYSTTPSVIVTGLDNDRTYKFRVYAHNAQGWGDFRESIPLQSQGPPGVPAAPRIRAVDVGGGAAADLIVTWPKVDANGPAQILYTVYRNGRVVAGCQAIPIRTCTFTGETYDGVPRKFEVSTVIGRQSSVKGDPGYWYAVAKPLEWGAWTVEPTGASAKARIGFSVPDSRGQASNVSVVVDGVASPLGDISGPQNRSIDVPDNDKAYKVLLSVCNEKSLCTESVEQKVQTWGPLQDQHIVSVTPDVSGESIAWTIKVDANGSPATLTFDSNRRAPRSWSVSNLDVSTFTVDAEALGFAVTERVSVTLSHDVDPSGDFVTFADRATTVDPPPAKITVVVGDKCNDGSGSSPCHTSGNGGWDCTDNSCAFISIAVKNFFDDVTCDINLPGRPDRLGVGPLADDALGPTDVYFGAPGESVRATCRNPSRSVSATDTLIWPN